MRPSRSPAGHVARWCYGRARRGRHPFGLWTPALFHLGGRPSSWRERVPPHLAPRPERANEFPARGTGVPTTHPPHRWMRPRRTRGAPDRPRGGPDAPSGARRDVAGSGLSAPCSLGAPGACSARRACDLSPLSICRTRAYPRLTEPHSVRGSSSPMAPTPGLNLERCTPQARS